MFWTRKEIKILREYYSKEEIDLDLLSGILGRHKTNICRKARKLGLTDKNRSKSGKHRRKTSATRKNWLANNEHPRGYLGHHPSKETRNKIGLASIKSWEDPSSGHNSDELKQKQSDEMTRRHRMGYQREAYSHGKMGKRTDLDGLYVRSSWEANYARYLNWLVSIGEIVKWEYEPDVYEFHEIKRGTRSYIPDFKVYNKDGSVEYHEVKGWMDQKSRTKLKRMAKYYPEIKVVLIDKDVYYAIKRDAQNFIPNWE